MLIFNQGNDNKENGADFIQNSIYVEVLLSDFVDPTRFLLTLSPFPDKKFCSISITIVISTCSLY